MPTFDTVSEADMQEVANATDQTSREVGTRFDFKGTSACLEFKNEQIIIRADNDFQLRQVREILHTKLAKRGVDIHALNASKIEQNNSQARQIIDIQQGIPQDDARKIVKLIKDKKLKVQVSIQGDKVRVSGKKRDDLQSVISLLKDSKLKLPLQYINFRD
ncbi:MAG: YajQ family cyclic di-GMP-binding protein [Gammaproteobacteria bacterium]